MVAVVTRNHHLPEHGSLAYRPTQLSNKAATQILTCRCIWHHSLQHIPIRTPLSSDNWPQATQTNCQEALPQSTTQGAEDFPESTRTRLHHRVSSRKDDVPGRDTVQTTESKCQSWSRVESQSGRRWDDGRGDSPLWPGRGQLLTEQAASTAIARGSIMNTLVETVIQGRPDNIKELPTDLWVLCSFRNENWL